MPTPYTKYTIAVKSSTNINPGESCKVTNLEGRGFITGNFSTGNECVLNPANSKLNWVVGDKLMIEVSGRLLGSKQVTLVRGGLRTTVTTTADASSPAIDL